MTATSLPRRVLGVTDRFVTGPVHDPSRYSVALDDAAAAVGGGEGVVYRAVHTATDREVALKLLTTVDLRDFPRVAERAALLQELDHPNLMPQLETFLGSSLGDGRVTDSAEFDVPYSVAGWIEGRPLTEAATVADTAQKLRWVTDIAAALDHLHSHRSDTSPGGLVHRDVKPSNVRIGPDGRAVLLDFGVARPVDPSDMTLGVGTYLWRSPEVLCGGASVGTAVDVWGLGAVAHWLFVGEPPQLDGAGPARERIATSLTTAGHQRARAVAGDVSRLLETSPTQRPIDLAAWSHHLVDRAANRRRRLVTAMATIAAVATVALVTVAVRQPSGGQRVDVDGEHAAAAAPTPASRLVNCTGGSLGPLVPQPALRDEPQDVVFGLSRDFTDLLCGTPENPYLPLRIDRIDVRFDDLGCASFADPASLPQYGLGTGSAHWNDADPVELGLVVRLDTGSSGSIRVIVTAGRQVGYEATVPLTLDDPIGTCENGVVAFGSATLGNVKLRPV